MHLSAEPVVSMMNISSALAAATTEAVSPDSTAPRLTFMPQSISLP